jgi:glutaredoxin
LFTCGRSDPQQVKLTQQTIKLLEKIGVTYNEVNIGNNSQKHFLQCAIHLHSGYTSFPNIYFGKEHVGGYDDLFFYTKDSENLTYLMAKSNISSKYHMLEIDFLSPEGNTSDDNDER